MVTKKELDTITEGDSIERKVTFEDGNGTIDISNWTVWWTIKKSETDPDSDAILQTKNGTNDHSDPANGETILSFDKTETQDIDQRTRDAVYDIQIKKGNGDVDTILKGVQPIEKDITEES